MTEEEMHHYCFELQMTLKDYEEYLRRQHYELKLEVELGLRNVNRAMSQLKEKCQFKLEAMESALYETQVKHRREMEQQ